MAAKLTQSQFIKKLAETVEVSAKVAKAMTTVYAKDLAVAGDQEERHGRVTRHRPAGACGSQGPPGPQPGDWRVHQDPSQEGGEVPRGEGRERRDRPTEEEVATMNELPIQKHNPARLIAMAGFCYFRKTGLRHRPNCGRAPGSLRLLLFVGRS